MFSSAHAVHEERAQEQPKSQRGAARSPREARGRPQRPAESRSSRCYSRFALTDSTVRTSVSKPARPTRSRRRVIRPAWTHLELMRRLWKGRLVLKGVLAAEDARIARESGVDGVIVSNHGGRQLDGAARRFARSPRWSRRRAA